MRGVRLRWVWSGAVAVLATWFFGRSDIGVATLPAFPIGCVYALAPLVVGPGAASCEDVAIRFTKMRLGRLLLA